MSYPVGTLVKLKIEMLGNPKESLGVAYEEYVLDNHKGTSFIFRNGNYDGFSEEEQILFVDKVGFDLDLSQYKFTNVIQLTRDFYDGMFVNAFDDRIAQ